MCVDETALIAVGSCLDDATSGGCRPTMGANVEYSSVFALFEGGLPCRWPGTGRGLTGWEGLGSLLSSVPSRCFREPLFRLRLWVVSLYSHSRLRSTAVLVHAQLDYDMSTLTHTSMALRQLAIALDLLLPAGLTGEC